jgi:hypothetical protein
MFEARLLEGIKRDLFTEEAFERFKQEANGLLAQRRGHPAVETLTKRLAATVKGGRQHNGRQQGEYPDPGHQGQA